MCGRFALDANVKTVKAQFHIDEMMDIEPRFNIAPTEEVLTLFHAGENHLKPVMLYWGLIPFWAKDKTIGQRLINARAETVSQKPAYRAAFKKRRCLVIMSGFFEWRREGERKQPFYFFQKEEQLLAVAAIWEHWQDNNSGESIHSCCLITTNANELMKPIHNRMPVILDEQTQSLWLDKEPDRRQLQSILRPYPHQDLACYPVTPKMNNARFKDKQAIEPIKQK